MIIISLSGKKQTGKTTIAEMIKDILGHKDVYIISWADALKEEVAKACGVSVKYIEEHKSNFRLILQGWGTDFRRELGHKCYWIEKLLVKLLELPSNCIAIIPDTRFLNEIENIKSVGAYLFKIERESKPTDGHISENELNNFTQWDCIINNNVSLGELRGTLEVELEKLHIFKPYVSTTS